jgi:tRNA dimethylallyltransferase
MTQLAEVRPPLDDEVLVVVGPTASGKSALALGLGERFGGEIISADSVQIYRAFDIGAGKPSRADRARVAHHLIDLADPLDPYDAARYAREADRAIALVRDRGRRPIVCGGTFLWVRALLYGLAPAAPADPEVRRRHQRIAAEEGNAALHAALGRVDPASAARLAPNDVVRVSRALEIHELTGTTQTEWHAAHGFREPRYRHRLIGVERSRDELDRRIMLRAQRMIAHGWLDEVQSLIDRGYGAARAMRSVGYKQVHAHLHGELEGDLLEAVIRATRVFARRQRTWLRDEAVDWLKVGSKLEGE